MLYMLHAMLPVVELTTTICPAHCVTPLKCRNHVNRFVVLPAHHVVCWADVKRFSFPFGFPLFFSLLEHELLTECELHT